MANINTSPIFNEIPTPLRFYDAKEKRNEYKLPCEAHCKYQLITPQHFLLPFMIVRDYQPEDIASFKIVDEDGDTVANLSTSLIERKTLLSKDYFIYKGQLHGQILTCGYYYAEVADSYGRVYYSERFYVMNSGYCGNFEVNGEFKTDLSGWTTTGNITWSSGKAVFGSGVIAKNMNRFIAYSTQVKVTFTISSWGGSGTANAQIGSTTILPITGNGTYSFTGSTQFVGKVYFYAQTSRTFQLDNVIVQPLSADSMDCSLMFEWKSDCDFGNIYYGSGFFNRFYLPTDATLGEPTYRITREVTTNGDGDQIEQFRKRQKVYRVELGLVPEYIVDALMDMQIHPVKKIYLNNCGGYANISDVNVAATWEFSGCYANVIITFSIDSIVEAGCCGNIPTCVEPCFAVMSELPEGDCVEGKYYIDGGDIYFCEDGVLVKYPCDSGYVEHDTEDTPSCPSGYILESGQWKEVPEVVSILPDGTKYNIKCRLMAGTTGQLQVSTNGGGTWANLGVEMGAGDWLSIGQSFTLVAATTYQFKINSENENCDYGMSCAKEFIVGCLESCQDAHGYKTPPYVVGEIYQLPDGTLGEATTVNGDFLLIDCPSGISHNIDDDTDYVYSATYGGWLPMPSLFNISQSGGMVTLFAALPIGSVGQLKIDGVNYGSPISAATWATGVTVGAFPPNAVKQFVVVASSGVCDYGTSEMEEVTIGSCTAYLAPSGADISPLNPVSDVWNGITIDGFFYDFGLWYGSNPQVNDALELKNAVQYIMDNLFGGEAVVTSLIGSMMSVNILQSNPAPNTINSIEASYVGVSSTLTFNFTTNCA